MAHALVSTDFLHFLSSTNGCTVTLAATRSSVHGSPWVLTSGRAALSAPWTYPDMTAGGSSGTVAPQDSFYGALELLLPAGLMSVTITLQPAHVGCGGLSGNTEHVI